jgi:transcriptional regulator with XRE-family HTH domain
MDELVKYGERVQKRRTQRKLTRVQLAELFLPPIDQATISRWERGLVEPSRHNRAEITRILGVTPTGYARNGSKT